MIDLLKNFNNRVNYFINKNKSNKGFLLQMSNEILLEIDVNLKKYLKKVNISKYDKKIDEIIINNYKNTVLFYH